VRDPAGEAIGGAILKAVEKEGAKEVVEQLSKEEIKEIDELVFKEIARMGLPAETEKQFIDRTVREAVGRRPPPFPERNPDVFSKQIVELNRIELRTKDGFRFVAQLDQKGSVFIDAHLVDPETRLRSAHAKLLGSGRENFERMFAHFGDRIKGWNGILIDDNFTTMEKLLPTSTSNEETIFGLFKSKTGGDFWLPWVQARGFTVQGTALMDRNFFGVFFDVQFVPKPK
jgi:hypothetical protein